MANLQNFHVVEVHTFRPRKGNFPLGNVLRTCREIDIKSSNLYITTTSAGDRDADITGNIFPEGIQLGSTIISEDIFRIPEGMRPDFCKIHLLNYIHLLNFLENSGKDRWKVQQKEMQYSLF